MTDKPIYPESRIYPDLKDPTEISTLYVMDGIYKT